MKAAVGDGQHERRQNVTFPYAANAQQAVVGCLIRRAGVPGHPYLAVVGANEIGEQVELVGTEVQHFLFDGGGLVGVRAAGRAINPAFVLDGVEPLAPRAE